MTKQYYAYQLNDKDVLSQSSSGGIFYSLAKYVLVEGGIVYGAAWNSDFTGVEIIKVDDISNLHTVMTSKYMYSNAPHYSEIKECLDSNIKVLYSGLPCQVAGLKNYLRKDYDNLICVEIVCHGALPSNMWRDYLQSINPDNKAIKAINMRDKRYGWKEYGMSIEFEDGSEYFEKHKYNKYMQAFLSDKYLNKSCYKCQFKNENSKADLTIGDYWGVDSNTSLDIQSGISLLVVNTEKGLELFRQVTSDTRFSNTYSITKEEASRYNGGMHNEIHTTPCEYNSSIFKADRVGIVTLNLNNNIGGVMQAFALQKFLDDNGHKATIIQSHHYSGKLSFAKKLKCEVVNNLSDLEHTFNSYVVGSDQVWRREYTCGRWEDSWKDWKPMFLDFTADWDVKRIAYAASCGSSELEYSPKELVEVKQLLNKFDALSTREIDSANIIYTLTNKQTTITCDPTLLLDREEYLKICRDVPKKPAGLFTYILDSNNNKTKAKAKIIQQLKVPETEMATQSVEEWLAAFRDCSCILTDSYHGVLFALIFNKPFICFANEDRGGSRFKTLVELFPKISNRIIRETTSINVQLEKTIPNIYGSSLWLSLTGYSKEFLLTNLSDKPLKSNGLRKVFGLVSYIPDVEPDRKLRIERLDRAFNQLNTIFPNAEFLVIAQNWKGYTPPKGITKIHVYHYDKLGILGARKKLREHFLDLDYDYLIMCDDDVIVKTDLKRGGYDYMDSIDKHPDGFMFLQYDAAQLNLCAISRYIYEQEPMVDIDPQKNEGYEDSIFSRLLHYKYIDREFFTIPCIRCTQFLNKNEKAPSTWAATNNHQLNWESVCYHVDQFKKGNFIVDKTCGQHLKDMKAAKLALKKFSKLKSSLYNKLKIKILKKYKVTEAELAEIPD